MLMLQVLLLLMLLLCCWARRSPPSVRLRRPLSVPLPLPHHGSFWTGECADAVLDVETGYGG